MILNEICLIYVWRPWVYIFIQTRFSFWAIVASSPSQREWQCVRQTYKSILCLLCDVMMMMWWWCDALYVSWKTLNTRQKNQDCALMCVIMFLYNYNYPTTTTGWGWTWTSSHQPPVHVQGWSRLNNQILLTSKIVNWTFTKRGKGSKSANNQNSFKSWSPLRVMLLDYFHCLFWTKTN